MGTSLLYGIHFELQSRVDRDVAAVKAEHKSLVLTDYNSPGVEANYHPPDTFATNAAPLYLAAMELSRDGNFMTRDTLLESIDQDADHLRQTVAARDPVWPLLQAASSRPDCQYRYSLGNTDYQPNYLGSRSLAQLISAKALVDVKDGKAQDAVTCLTQGMKFARRLHQGDTLINTMIRVALSAILMESMSRMAHDHVPADYSALIQECDLMQADLDSSMARSIDVERAADYTLFSDAHRVVDVLPFYGDKGGARWAATWVLYSVAGPVWCLADQAEVLEYCQQAEAGLNDMQSAGYGQVPPYQAEYGSDAARTESTQHMAAFIEDLKQHQNPLWAASETVNDNHEHHWLVSKDELPVLTRAVFQVRQAQANLRQVHQQLAQLNVAATH
jgi:hypothetical protein